MASSVSTASEVKSREQTSNEAAVDSKSSGTLIVSQLPSENKTVQLVLTQGSGSTQQLGPANANSRAPVVIASVSPSDQAKKGSLVARLTQGGGEHLTGGQVAKICASTPPMNNVNSGTGSGKPKAFAAMMGGPGGGDNPPTTSSPQKQSTKKGAIMQLPCA